MPVPPSLAHEMKVDHAEMIIEVRASCMCLREGLTGVYLASSSFSQKHTSSSRFTKQRT